MNAAHDIPADAPEPPALPTALRLLQHGLCPVPLYPPGERIGTLADGSPKLAKGKEPIGSGWGLTRHTPETLRAAYAARPEAGVGIKLGQDGGVIDIEVEDRETGPDTLLDLMGGEVPNTVGWDSERGPHHLFRYTPRLARYKAILKGDWLPGLEIRIGATGSGGQQYQSACPPTRSADGVPRRWHEPTEIADLPDAFFAYLDEHMPRPGPKVAEAPRTIKFTGPRPEGSYDVADVTAVVRPHFQELAAGWGVRFTGRVFDGDWAECHAIDRADRTPSAGLNLQSGVYHDFGTEAPGLGFYSLAVTLGAYPDFPTAVNALGERYGARNRAKEAKEANKPFRSRTSFASCASFAGGSGANNGASFASCASFAGDSEDEMEEVAVRRWPDPPGEAAWHGIAGEIVGFLAPHTESDPAAILAQFLVGFGNLIGRTAYFEVEADRHYGNLFACLVGPSSKARKGTSWGHVRRILAGVELDWAEKRILTGLSSGEGLIWAVRDPITKKMPVKEKGRIIDYQDEIIDEGIADKRILALEPEMAGPLKGMAREGNTLSALVRRAWDDGNLRTLTKNSPAVSTGAHVSIVGHITRDEVTRLLNSTEAANGFGNRFLWVCVRRSRSLPFGGLAHRADFSRYQGLVAQAVATARERGPMARDGEADTLWVEHYDLLSEGKPGLLGAVLGRAEAQVMRLAMLYALLDFAPAIGRVHLEAALALWRYCEDSARYVFGETMGDGADEILEALEAIHPDGLKQSEIHGQVFGRHASAVHVAQALSRLLEMGRVRCEPLPTGGRPATVWYATRSAMARAKEAREANEGGEDSGDDPAKEAKEAQEVPEAALADAERWLRDWLADGLAWPEHVRERAAEAGIGPDLIDEAARNVGVDVGRREGREWWGLSDAAYWDLYDDWEA